MRSVSGSIARQVSREGKQLADARISQILPMKSTMWLTGKSKDKIFLQGISLYQSRKQ